MTWSYRQSHYRKPCRATQVGTNSAISHSFISDLSWHDIQCNQYSVYRSYMSRLGRGRLFILRMFEEFTKMVVLCLHKVAFPLTLKLCKYTLLIKMFVMEKRQFRHNSCLLLKRFCVYKIYIFFSHSEIGISCKTAMEIPFCSTIVTWTKKRVAQCYNKWRRNVF